MKDGNGWESYNQYYFPTAEIKHYNLMIDGRNFFDQPIKYNLKTYDNIRKTATCQGGDCTTGYLLDCRYFKKYYELIAIDLSKQKRLDVDPKSIQQVNFNRTLTRE